MSDLKPLSLMLSDLQPITPEKLTPNDTYPVLVLHLGVLNPHVYIVTTDDDGNVPISLNVDGYTFVLSGVETHTELLTYLRVHV